MLHREGLTAINKLQKQIEATERMLTALKIIEEGMQKYQAAAALLNAVQPVESLCNSVISSIANDVPDAGTATSVSDTPEISFHHHTSSNIEQFEAILLDNGYPMLLREITAEALKRGMTFGGRTDKPPSVKIRNSLFGSKRFCNLGNNVWWITRLDVPPVRPPKLPHVPSNVFLSDFHPDQTLPSEGFDIGQSTLTNGDTLVGIR